MAKVRLSRVRSWVACAGPGLLASLACGGVGGEKPIEGDGQWPLVDCALPASDDGSPSPLATVQHALWGAQLVGMGDLEGGEYLSEARGVDAGGERVVGIGTSAEGTRAVVWSAKSGLVAMAHAPSAASAVDASGCVVVGSAWTLVRPRDERSVAARWVGAAEVEFIPAEANIYSRSDAVAVSADGLSIVGIGSQDVSSSGFVWRNTGISNSPPDNFENLGINADGSVLIGLVRRSRSGGPAYAIRNGQPLPYPFLADPACTTGSCQPCITPGQCVASAHGVSADGRIIVGSASQLGAADGSVAVQWVISGDQVSMRILSATAAEARAVSADGRVVVGVEAPFGERRVVRWVDGRSESISAALEAAGGSAGAWQLTQALGVSADGGTIVGTGINPDGDPEGWIARLPVR